MSGMAARWRVGLCAVWIAAVVALGGLLVLGLVGSVPAQAPGGLQPGTQPQSITHGGATRTYLVHIPPAYDGRREMPLVLVFHGGGGTGAVAERTTGFSPVADREGFIAVYPDATNRQWNDGRLSSRLPTDVDDVAFVAALLDHLLATLRIDPLRVYATGISNGGFMSHRLGAELSSRIAAIGPVAGTLGENVVPRFAPRQPVSVIDLHGTADRFVRYEGGEVIARGGIAVSVARVIELWAKAAGCSSPPRVETLPDRDPGDGTRVRRESHTPCRQGTEVVLYTIEGGGHNWPGRPAPRPALGPATREIDATQVIWEFFRSHAKQSR